MILNLPIPPSVNTFQRDRNRRPLGNKSTAVQHWIKLADGFLYTQKRGLVGGDYVATITWCEHQFRKFDVSNRIKPLEDYLQSRELIENDKLCWHLQAGWGDVEKDWCRVEIKPRGE